MYSCIVLSFFWTISWKFDMPFLSLISTSSMCCSLAFFFFLFFQGLIHAMNSSKKFMIGNFFSPSSNSTSLLLSSISFSVELSQSPVVLVKKLHKKCFTSLLLLCAWKLLLTYRKYFCISDQFLILLRLIMAIVWYAFPFTSAYFASW